MTDIQTVDIYIQALILSLNLKIVSVFLLLFCVLCLELFIGLSQIYVFIPPNLLQSL